MYFKSTINASDFSHPTITSEIMYHSLLGVGGTTFNPWVLKFTVLVFRIQPCLPASVCSLLTMISPGVNSWPSALFILPLASK